MIAGGQAATHVVSELLGSFGCNELSPECLEGLYQTDAVTTETVSIPSRYISYVAPVSSTKLYQQARAQALYPNESETACLGLTVAMETPYVVRTHAASQTHVEKACWEFCHPFASANRYDALFERSAAVMFPPNASNGCGNGSGFGAFETQLATSSALLEGEKVPVDTLVHGFLGTFVADFYRSKEKPNDATIQISTAPSDHFSAGMFSWFPLYFPIDHPLRVPATASIVVDVCRKVIDNHVVWYEWSMSVMDAETGTIFESSTIANSGGRSYKVEL